MDETKKTPDCEFCKMLEGMKAQINDMIANNMRSNKPDVKYDISLNSRSFIDGRQTGSTSIGGYALNFCPVCGKPISE